MPKEFDFNHHEVKFEIQPSPSSSLIKYDQLRANLYASRSLTPRRYPYAEAVLSKLSKDLVGSLEEDPNLTRAGNFWITDRKVTLDGQKRKVIVMTRGDKSVSESTEIDVYIAGLNTYLKFKGESVVTRLKREEGYELSASGHDSLFWEPIIEKFKHPEGLTGEQEKLVDLLYRSPIEGPCEIGKRCEDGSISKRKTTTDRVLAFAQDGWGFFFKHHETHPDAPLAPDKVNLRGLTPKILDQIGVVFEEAMGDDKSFDVCAGIPNAGLPLASAFSKRTGVENLDIFEKEEKDGIRRIFLRDGVELDGGKLLIVDDVISAGLTKDEAFAPFDRLGQQPALFVVIDRQEGGMDSLLAKGRDVKAVINRTQALDYGVRLGYITQEQFAKSIKYSEDFKQFQEGRLVQ